MFSKKTTFAILVLATGLAAATSSQAGQGSVMLGGTGFADRCTSTGGQLLDIDDGYTYQLPTTLLECTFAGAYADCAWNGVQNKLEVVRVIGMIRIDSPSGGGNDSHQLGGGNGGGGGGGVGLLDLPIKNK